MLRKRTKIGLWTVALLTALVGVVNLLSAVTPSLSGWIQWLEQIFSFSVRAGGHLFAAIASFILLTLAANLLRCKRVAWWLAVGLIVLSSLSHLLKGLDYEESLLASVLLVQLLMMRQVFTAQSDRPSIAYGIRVLVGALLLTLADGTVGFFILNGQYRINQQPLSFNFSLAILQTLAMFFTADHTRLQILAVRVSSHRSG